MFHERQDTKYQDILPVKLKKDLSEQNAINSKSIIVVDAVITKITDHKITDVEVIHKALIFKNRAGHIIYKKTY